MATFGERVKELRNLKGLTQRQMANALSINERNYQRYEATESPSNENLIKMAKFFEVSTDYLLGRSDEYNVTVITPQIRKVISDKKLSLEAKGLYMQLQLYVLDNRLDISNDDDFFKENEISKKEFDEIIMELQSLNYIKIEGQTDTNDYKIIYFFTDDV